ncbi:hypothetical protein NIES4072_48520 [Nostoc commune NIES-4072]|uniref:Uncharacterized protein n=1 Tax=Nostoc commune NIES-4072 TaxID=2005467 RepID=A0A2R5FT24_NOSCO|nr:hypothetical protein NIES4072_48520 [Nostoc commune NIES-4072]
MLILVLLVAVRNRKVHPNHHYQNPSLSIYYYFELAVQSASQVRVDCVQKYLLLVVAIVLVEKHKFGREKYQLGDLPASRRSFLDKNFPQSATLNRDKVKDFAFQIPLFFLANPKNLAHDDETHLKNLHYLATKSGLNFYQIALLFLNLTASFLSPSAVSVIGQFQMPLPTCVRLLNCAADDHLGYTENYGRNFDYKKTYQM